MLHLWWRQLNKEMSRAFWTYLYFAGLALAIAVLNFVYRPLDAKHPDRFVHVAVLCVPDLS